MLSSLKTAAAGAASTTSSFFSSPREVEGGRSSAAAAFSAARRRLVQSALTGLGKAAPSKDADFEARKGQLEALGALLRDARRDAQGALDGARKLCLSQARLGSAARAVGGGSALAEAFAGTLEAADCAPRESLEEALTSRVLRPLDALIAQCDALRPAVRDRDNLKTDVDARQRAVDGLKSSPGTSREQLLHKQDKLDKTRAALGAATAAVLARLEPLEAEAGEGGSLLAALAAFGATLGVFYLDCHGSLGKVPPPLPPRAG